jgi:hypothetical protein
VSQLPEEEKKQINQYNRDFGETNRYSPGTLHIKFNDNADVQYLEDFFANKITFDQWYDKQLANAKNTQGPESEAILTIAEKLKELNKTHTLLSITRPRIRLHNPEVVYLNNYYYITFEKRYLDNNWEEDTLYASLGEWPEIKYIARDPIMKDAQISDPSYSNDPRKSNLWHFGEQYTKTYHAWSAIGYYDQ